MSHDFWNACLVRLEQELPPQQFNTWIRALEAGAVGPDSAEQINLLAPNRFVLQWVRERYLHRIEQLGAEFFGKPVGISLELGGKSPKSGAKVTESAGTAPAVERRNLKPATNGSETRAREDADDTVASELSSVKPAEVTTPAISAQREKTRLNHDFTFETLVTGRANDLARAAAMQVSQNPGSSYNPLFIYGGVGLGKTHLVQAIGNEVLRDNPRAIVRYVHSEDYVADVVRAYQQKSFDQFKRYYRSLDLLIIDDIQFIRNKERTQEEFFHAFNGLVEARKQIVITCDTYPKDIEGLQDRLISRFDWGLTVQIEPPELEMRVAILKKKADADGIELADEVAFLIAKNLRSNVRELEGALRRVMAYARFHGRDISLELAKEALRDLLAAFNRQLTIEVIQKTVADYYKIKLTELLSQKRTRNIARPRQIAMYLTKELTPASLPAIGEGFGGRDHTTVLHACRTIAELRLADQQINHDLHVLTQTLRG
ncbi:chromosomal replication initiator protein DnaA [Viridibacterium curvum]|uniref:Chromosomal replication initiator protein DnaA n=1 Tax=Viridibacterium curvum TaxID=1101404 RepID=A0ABP9QRS5_9RHOO